MKNFMISKISWLQKNPNVIGSSEVHTIADAEKKTKKKGTKGGIKCPEC